MPKCVGSSSSEGVMTPVILVLWKFWPEDCKCGLHISMELRVRPYSKNVENVVH